MTGDDRRRTWKDVNAREIVAMIPEESRGEALRGLGLPSRVMGSLSEQGFASVQDLGALADVDLLVLRGIGPKGLDAIKRALRTMLVRTRGDGWRRPPDDGASRADPDDVSAILRGFPDAWLDAPLSSLPFSRGTLNAFARGGLRTLRDLTDDDLILGLPDMGTRRLRSVKRLVRNYPDQRIEEDAAATARRSVERTDSDGMATRRREEIEDLVAQQSEVLAAAYGEDLLSELQESLAQFKGVDRTAVESVVGLGQPEATLARAAELLGVSKQAVDQRVHAVLHRIGAARGWDWRFRDALQTVMEGCQEPMPLPSVCAIHPFLSRLERHQRLFSFLVRLYLRADTNVVAIPVLHLYPFADMTGDGSGRGMNDRAHQGIIGREQEP